MATDQPRHGDPDAPDARPAGSLGSLADLSELLGGDTSRSRRFIGGLIAGALVGAAVAGGTLLRLRKGTGRT
ncbi:MAG TPA: hypothetical protein VGM28_09010 [Candidatus Limnocylindrales bacterium]|jgi:hypothetical protein